MARYKHYNYSQLMMVPVCLDEQLMPGTLEHTIHTLIENEIDLSVFDSRYNMTRPAAPPMIPKFF